MNYLPPCCEEWITIELSENARITYEKRYLKKDLQGKPLETPEDLLRRVASNMAAIEREYGKDEAEIKKIEEEFFQAMAGAYFLPNSPTLMNAGRDLQQLSACFVLPVEDSMEGIFTSLKHMALVQKTGGGTGFAFDRLRPAGDRVQTTNGVASGPISFLKIFDAATEAVKQGGARRGANMGSLIYNHPDILEFISCKEKEGEISNFNLSVTVSDGFMRKATGEDQDPYYPLINPRTGEPHTDPETGEVVQLHAGEVFDLIVEKAWAKGDPGVIFIEQMNRFNPTPHIGKYETTNPCVPGDTLVLTAEGPRRVMDLLGKSTALIINGKPFETAPAGFFPTGVKPLFTIRTKEGYSLRLTGDHPVLRVKKKTRHTLEKEWSPAADLRPGDEIMLHDHRGLSGWNGLYGEKEGYLMGLLMGDGTLKSDRAVLSAWQAPGTAGVMEAAHGAALPLPHRSDFKGWFPVRGRNEYRMSTAGIKKLALSLGLGPDKAITPYLETRTSSDFVRGFLRGFFDADGSVQGNREKGVSIRVSQSDLERLRAVQRMLGRFGIKCSIFENRRGRRVVLLPKGPGQRAAHVTGPQHELIISGENMALFAGRVGLCNTAKKNRLFSALASYRRKLNGERFTVRVDAVVPGAAEPVYDVQVPGINAFDANGFVVHNCGEQPLLPYEACCLASLNLGKFATEEREVDWEKLREVTRTAVRFLDNTIDSSNYVVQEIDRMHKGNRKIGLGVMGWHDMLVRLGLPYDSEAALETAERVMSFVNEEAKICSVELASERGVFPNFEGSTYDTGRPEDRVRNATRTTIAPTGTISILAGAGSGIEPYFSIAFLRKNILGGVDLPEVNPLFLELARREGFYSEELIRDIARTGFIPEDEEAVPARIKGLFKTAMEIAPEWHIRHQAVFQKYTDNAVSKTINLSREATAEDIKRAYVLAWESGCKGITVYRDGSREQQVLNVGVGNEESLRPSSRPATLTGHTTCIKTSMGNLFVTVNTAGGKPFELFAQIGKAGSDVVAFTEAIARLISLALRCGVGVEEIVAQLEGIGGSRSVGFGPNRIMSVPDAIGRALARLVEVKPGENGAAHFFREICPDCGSGAMIRVEGCAKCEACGYSEC